MRRGFLLSGIVATAPMPKSESVSVPTPELAAESAPEPVRVGPTCALTNSAWAKYLTGESIFTMSWAMGEVFIREHDITLDKLNNHWARVAGGFYGLLLLGKQGNLSEKQFWSLYGPNPRARGPQMELYKELPQDADRQVTVRNLIDLKALITEDVLVKMKQGKYSAWLTYESRETSIVDIIVIAIWCIGGLIATPLGKEFTVEQKKYVDILYALHTPYMKDAKQTVAGVRDKAYADFEATFPSQ